VTLRSGRLQTIQYRFDNFEALNAALEAEDLELGETRAHEGQWVLATFIVGAESTSLAARVVDCGAGLRLRLEERDHERLRDFAAGNTRPSMRPQDAEPARGLPPGSRALVVSGSAAVASIVSQLVSSWGAEVCSLGSVEEALDFLRHEQIDVIVLDSMLPGLDCTELCHALGRVASGKPGVLLLGQDPTCADAHAALAAGADDFVQKPFRAQELRARLVGLLGQRERLCG